MTSKAVVCAIPRPSTSWVPIAYNSTPCRISLGVVFFAGWKE